MVEILLNTGKIIQVDDIDADLKAFNWSDNGFGYGYRRCRGNYLQLHVVIAQRMGISAKEVDHKDRNLSNCFRSNLRGATHSQNSANSSQPQSNSGYRGVTYDKIRHKYKATLKHRGDILNLGRFDTDVEAARVRDRAAKEFHGEFAILNFPEEA